jgi:type VI secretion system protein ImpH
MAGQDRTTSRAVILSEAFEKAPYRYDFYTVLRRIECLHRELPRLGEAVRPGEEPVRLGQEPSLAFAPASLAKFIPGTDGHLPRLSVNFFGVLGPNGPLPLHLTEYARSRMYQNHDATFARFLDVFHHRLLLLFYRAWAESQPTTHLDRPNDDRFATYLGSLCGLGLSSHRNRDAISDNAKQYFSGHFSCQTRHAEGLRAVISTYFQMPAEIEQWIGQWVKIPEKYYWLLGKSQVVTSSKIGILGSTAVAGRRVWERQHKFRIVLGPLDREQFDRMLPRGESLKRLIVLVRNYIGDQLTWDLRLVLKKESMQPSILGVNGVIARTSWLIRDTFHKTWEDLVIDPFSDGG